MNNRTRLAAKEYAKFAIKNSANEEVVDSVADSLECFRECAGRAEFKNLIFSPKVKYTEKMNVIEKIKGKYKLSPVALDIVRILVQKGQLSLLDMIEQEFHRLALEYKGITEVKCISFRQLTKQQKASVKEVLEAELEAKAEIEWQVDKTLLGGILFELNNKIIDLSYKGILNKLQRESFEILETV